MDTLRGGERGRLEVNRRVMELYFRPLQVYLLGSSFRRLGEARDLVAGFFSDRLGRDGFFLGWQAREMRLRHWLLGGFKQFLLETARQIRDERGTSALGEEPESPRENHEKALDREFARCLVEAACRRTRDLLAEKGQCLHWLVLMEHYHKGRQYEDLAAELGLDGAQIRGMARTAREMYRRILRDMLASDGADRSRIQDEISYLLEALEG